MKMDFKKILESTEYVDQQQHSSYPKNTSVLELLHSAQYDSLKVESLAVLRGKHLGRNGRKTGRDIEQLQISSGKNGVVDAPVPDEAVPMVTSVAEAVLNDDLDGLRLAIKKIDEPPSGGEIANGDTESPTRQAWKKNRRQRELDGCFNEERVNALVLASEKGMREHVKLLVEARANVDHPTKKHATPLTFAIHRQRVEVVEILLKGKADACQTKFDMVAPASPIHLACNAGCLKIVKMLVEVGVQLRNGDSLQNTPLITSIKNSKPHVANFLLNHAISVAKEHPKDDKYDDILAKNHQSMVGTALTLALEKKIWKTAELLLTYGADPNVAKSDGVSPLFIATKKGHQGMVKLCIKAKANINYVIDSSMTSSLLGMNALKFAANKRDFFILKLLLESNANPNACGPAKVTVMHHLAREIYELSSKSIASPKKLVEDQAKMLKKLAEFGGDPYLRDRDGNTVENLTVAYPDVQGDIFKAVKSYKNYGRKKKQKEEEEKKKQNAKRLAKKRKEKTKRKPGEGYDSHAQTTFNDKKAIALNEYNVLHEERSASTVTDGGAEGGKKKKKKKKRKKILTDAERARRELLYEEEIQKKGEQQQRAKRKRREEKLRAQMKQQLAVEKTVDSSQEEENTVSEEVENPEPKLPPTNTIISPEDLLDGFQPVVKKHRRRSSQRESRNDHSQAVTSNHYINSGLPKSNMIRESPGHKIQKNSRKFSSISGSKVPSPRSRNGLPRSSPRRKNEFPLTPQPIQVLKPNLLGLGRSPTKSLSNNENPSRPPLSHNPWGQRRGAANSCAPANWKPQTSPLKATSQTWKLAKPTPIRGAWPSKGSNSNSAKVEKHFISNSKNEQIKGKAPFTGSPPDTGSFSPGNVSSLKSSPKAAPDFPLKSVNQNCCEKKQPVVMDQVRVPNPHEFEPASPTAPSLSLNMPLLPPALSGSVSKQSTGQSTFQNIVQHTTREPVVSRSGVSGPLSFNSSSRDLSTRTSPHRSLSLKSSVPSEPTPPIPTASNTTSSQAINYLPQFQNRQGNTLQSQSLSHVQHPQIYNDQKNQQNNNSQHILQHPPRNQAQQNPSQNLQKPQRNQNEQNGVPSMQQPQRNQAQLNSYSVQYLQRPCNEQPQRLLKRKIENKIERRYSKTPPNNSVLPTQLEQVGTAAQMINCQRSSLDQINQPVHNKNVIVESDKLIRPKSMPLLTTSESRINEPSQINAQITEIKGRSSSFTQCQPSERVRGHSQPQVMVSNPVQLRLPSQSGQQNPNTTGRQNNQQHKNNHFVQAGYPVHQQGRPRFASYPQMNNQHRQWIEQQQHLLYMQMCYQQSQLAQQFYQTQGRELQQINTMNPYQQAQYYQQLGGYPYGVVQPQHYQIQQSQANPTGVQGFEHYPPYSLASVPYFDPTGAYTAQVQAQAAQKQYREVDQSANEKRSQKVKQNSQEVSSKSGESSSPNTLSKPWYSGTQVSSATVLNLQNPQHTEIPASMQAPIPINHQNQMLTSKVQAPLTQRHVIESPNAQADSSQASDPSNALPKVNPILPIVSGNVTPSNVTPATASLQIQRRQIEISPTDPTHSSARKTSLPISGLSQTMPRPPIDLQAPPPGLRRSSTQQSTTSSPSDLTAQLSEADPPVNGNSQPVNQFRVDTIPLNSTSGFNHPSTYQNKNEHVNNINSQKIVLQQPTSGCKQFTSPTQQSQFAKNFPSSSHTQLTPLKQPSPSKHLTSKPAPSILAKQKQANSPQTQPSLPRSYPRVDIKAHQSTPSKPWGRKKAWASLAASSQSANTDQPMRLNVVGQNSTSNTAGFIQKGQHGHWRILLHIPPELNSKSFAHSILANGGELHKEIMRTIGVRISIHPKSSKCQWSAKQLVSQNMPVDVEISSEKMESVRNGALRLLQIVNKNLPGDKQKVCLQDLAIRPKRTQAKSQPVRVPSNRTTQYPTQPVQKAVAKKPVVLSLKPSEVAETPAFVTKPRSQIDPSVCQHCGMHKITDEICVFDDTFFSN